MIDLKNPSYWLTKHWFWSCSDNIPHILANKINRNSCRSFSSLTWKNQLVCKEAAMKEKRYHFHFPFPQNGKGSQKSSPTLFQERIIVFLLKNGQLPFFSGWAAAWQLEFGIDRKILVAKFLLIRCERSSLLGGSKISCMRLSGHLVGPGFTLWLGLSLPDRSSTDDQLQANAGADLAGWWRRTTKCGAVQWAAESKRPRGRGRGSRQRKIWGGGPLLRCKAALVLTNKYLLREVKMR